MTDVDKPVEPAPVDAVSIEVSGSAADGTVTLRARGALDADTFAAALARASDTAAPTLVVDLSGVTAFSMEAAAALLTYRHTAATPSRRLLLRPSPAVTRRLGLLGLTAAFSESTPPS